MRIENYQKLTDEQLANVMRTALTIVHKCQQTLEYRGYDVDPRTETIRKEL